MLPAQYEKNDAHGNTVKRLKEEFAKLQIKLEKVKHLYEIERFHVTLPTEVQRQFFIVCFVLFMWLRVLSLILLYIFPIILLEDYNRKPCAQCVSKNTLGIRICFHINQQIYKKYRRFHYQHSSFINTASNEVYLVSERKATKQSDFMQVQPGYKITGNDATS